MLKKRIIFKLLFNGKKFCLSRNFNLQEVGDINWLYEKLKFGNFANYLDELVVLNVDKSQLYSFDNFIKITEKLIKKTFIPVTIGGSIDNFSQVKKCFGIGADKIIITSQIINKKLINEVVDTYGSQALICGIDVRHDKKKLYTYLNNGNKKFLEFSKHVKLAKKMKFGELFINSIDKDGTGTGFLDPKYIIGNSGIPIIWSGGAGKPEHFSILKDKKISALATGNLFNFLGDGLLELRKKLINKKIQVKKLITNY